jgi:transposase
VPETTVRVARAAFPKRNPYLTLRDVLGTLFRDEDFTDLFPTHGQPAFCPWRLALVTILQCREHLADRQAAEAVRARIDWKYLLGLELTDPGFDYSLLGECRARLMAGGAEQRLLERLLTQGRTQGLLKARGRQRTDATHVLAAGRELNHLALVGETLRAALHALATVAPAWLSRVVPSVWYQRYGRRIEDSRLPQAEAERQAYAQMVGEDGGCLLDLVDHPESPCELKQLAQVRALRTAWRRHYERQASPAPGSPQVRFKTTPELAQAAEDIVSPYDTEARYRRKRDTAWIGYMVHLSETCADAGPHLITHVHTTTAEVHEARCTSTIHQALADKGLPPHEHVVDSAYVSAELLVQSQADYDMTFVGPLRQNPSWQKKAEGAYDIDKFTMDWDTQMVHGPQGHASRAWRAYVNAAGHPYIVVRFRKADCSACAVRSLCTRARAQQQPRCLYLHPKAHQEAVQAAQERLGSEAGKQLYQQRAGVEGTLSQGVRAFGLRQAR